LTSRIERENKHKSFIFGEKRKKLEKIRQYGDVIIIIYYRNRELEQLTLLRERERERDRNETHNVV